MNRIRKIAAGSAMAAAAVAGGAVGAGFLGTASAQTNPSSTSSDSSSTATAPGQPAPGTAEHEALETPVTGDAASQAQAAAVASVGSGTAGDVTTDGHGDGYEVTVTKDDGTTVEVHLDSSFAVLQGHGPGGHGGGPGGPGGGPHSANGITEAPLTGDDLAKATAAADAAEPGATVDRAETDADGDAFEVHMTLADGSHVTVKLDSGFNVTSTDTGPG